MDDLSTRRPGWVGNFTTHNAPGAIQAGGRIIKVAEEPGDTTPLRTGGNVLGSMLHPQRGILYFIEWDDKPRYAVAVIAWKVGAT